MKRSSSGNKQLKECQYNGSFSARSCVTTGKRDRQLSEKHHIQNLFLA